MIQEILTYITVAVAFAFAIRSIYKTFFPAEGQTPCSSCISSGCGTKSLVTGKNIKRTDFKNMSMKVESGK